MEATTLRVPMETTSHRSFNRRADRIAFWRLITGVAAFSILACSELRADIPWAEVVQRLSDGKQKLGGRPQGTHRENLIFSNPFLNTEKSCVTFESGFEC